MSTITHNLLETHHCFSVQRYKEDSRSQFWLRQFSYKVAMLIFLFTTSDVFAAKFVVDYWGDRSDSNAGDGVCLAVGFGCTLRAAVEEANLLPGGPHEIEVPQRPGGSPSAIFNTPVCITADMMIYGSVGAHPVLTTNSSSLSICNGSQVSIQHLSFTTVGSAAVAAETAGAVVSIEDAIFVPGSGVGAPGLDVSAGQVTCERCIFRNGASSAVTTSGDPRLTLIESMIYSNDISEGSGGGMLLNGGEVVLLRSTLDANRTLSPTSEGGGIASSDTDLAIINSTISRNQAQRSGGGILFSNGTLTLRNATIAGNVANADKSASSGDWFGGGIQANTLGIVHAENTIIADNEAFCDTPGCAEDWFGADCAGLGFDSYGFNLVTHTAGCIINAITVNNDILNVASSLSGAVISNGGPTWTMALLPGSPAIDGGNPAGCTDDLDFNPDSAGNLLTTDQRLIARPQDGDGNLSAICDIGAFELEAILMSEEIFGNGFE